MPARTTANAQGMHSRAEATGTTTAPPHRMLTSYPVHYTIVPPATRSRLQLLIRLIAFCAIGTLGLSFGAVFLFAFLALPAYAASRMSARGATAGDYVTKDGPAVLRSLRWLAAISAWTGLIADDLPSHSPDETVHLEVDGTPHPTPGSVLMRVITGIPSAIVLGILCWVGVFVWMWAALTILISERVGVGAFSYLAGLQRWSIRLLVYQAGLVDEYPPFSFADQPAASLPTARVTT